MALKLERPAEGEERAGHGEAAVHEHDERSAHVAAGADLLRNRHADDLLGEAGVAVVLGPWARREHRRARARSPSR